MSIWHHRNFETRSDATCAPARRWISTKDLTLALGLIAASSVTALAQAPSFVAPPRTITDINATLDGERPNLTEIAARQALASSSVPAQLANKELAQFYYRRAVARWDLGRVNEAISDCDEAIKVAKASSVDPYEYQTLLLRYAKQIEPSVASGVLEDMVHANSAPDQRWKLLAVYRHYSYHSIILGRLADAELYLKRSEAIMADAKAKSIPPGVTSYWVLEETKARVLEQRGLYAAAERSYHQAQEYNRKAIADQVARSPTYNLRNSQAFNADSNIVREARMKMLQGRVVEAEADMRRALLSRLATVGKYNTEMPAFILALADAITAQGRFAEAEKLVRTALEINQTLGIARDSPQYLTVSKSLATILSFEDRWSEVAGIFDEIDQATANWPAQQRDGAYRLNTVHVNALYKTGRTSDGIELARALLRTETGRLGENHFEAAKARGYLAIGLARANRDVEASREFRAAIPFLKAQTSDNEEENGSLLADQARWTIVESYISLLARGAQATRGADVEEGFRLADLIRGSVVQGALARSSARAVAGDEALSRLVRREQDLGMQVAAQLGLLNNLLAIPSAKRDEKGFRDVNASIAKLGSERNEARAEIIKRFPAYADLVDPKPPSVEQIKATLDEGEAMLSFYFGRDASFVWAVPKEGAVAFAAINVASGEIANKVRKLRDALAPEAAMISDIPPFDLKLGYELYSLLLKPVEAGWKHSKNLIVVTNGALGLLPLSLLPTAPAEIKTGDDPLFSNYRAVPWLARTHAVTMVPSSAALRTLRALPPGKPGRGELIAFGDPLFSAEQAADATKAQNQTKVADTGAATTRGMPLKRRSSPKLDDIDSAELAMLPRLPDTADELKSIALVLQADPSKALNLGKDANEQAVKTMDLSGFKVLAFATHGLVPGELNGLTQPALALSAPAVAGVAGDGLLTMEEILALKLDADWVVLSACNTGAGSGAGAEAASGLGRAFFYAGTRAILVTNWSVHSQSARELVTDLFKRQADDPKLTRGEALRQAMMALVDGPGYIGVDGKTEFAYAHPLFWAPYSVIGDGGTR